MEKIFKLVVGAILIGMTLFFYSACSNKAAPLLTNKKEHLVEKWKVGTYTGMFVDFSQEEFNTFKRDGIDYIELNSAVFKNKTTEERVAWINDFKKKADQAGLKVWSVHLPYSKKFDISTTNDEDRNFTIEEHKILIALLTPLNVKKFVIHPSADRIEDSERPVRIENCISSLKILTKEMQKYDADLALEVLPRTCLANTAEELLLIVNSVGNGLEVCFDTNHLLQEKPEEFVAKVGNLITTVHISDYDGVDEKHWLPGRGVINWNNVISELVNINFQGPFMHEVLPRPEDDPKPTTKDIVDSWQVLKSNYLSTVRN